MGLFYTALERAQAAEAEAGAKPAAGEPVAAPRTWEQAAAVDLAGFPLPLDPSQAVAPAAPAEVAPRRAIRLRQPLWEMAAQAESARMRAKLKLDCGIALEQSRILRTRVLEAMRARSLQTLLITSAAPGEGKSLIAAGLAMQISSLRELRVLLIDADLRRAGMSALMDPRPEAGLAEYLRGEAAAENLLWDVDPYLAVMPTTPLAELAPELLASQRMAELLAWARQQFDVILLDGAPVGPVVDSRILARWAGGALLVVRAENSQFEAVAEAAKLLQPYLLGSVLNDAPKLHRTHYGYPYRVEDSEQKRA